MSEIDKDRRSLFFSWLIGPIFLALGIWLFFLPRKVALPLVSPVRVDQSQLSTAPARKTLGDPPIAFIHGYWRNCMDCHRLFKSPRTRNRPLMAHEQIKLDHGINDNCMNCHDQHNRDRLRLLDGKSFPFTEAHRLCGQCHGPAYRDWQAGTHGKTLGYWLTRGDRKPRRLKCTECHDPHAPAFSPVKPLPGPNTLRSKRHE